MLEEEVSFDLPVRSHASLKKQFCKMYKKSCLGINGVSYELMDSDLCKILIAISFFIIFLTFQHVHLYLGLEFCYLLSYVYKM